MKVPTIPNLNNDSVHIHNNNNSGIYYTFLLIFILIEFVITILYSFHQGLILLSPLLIVGFSILLLIYYFIKTTIPLDHKIHKVIPTHETSEERFSNPKEDVYKIYWISLIIIYWWSYGYWLQLFPDMFPSLATTIITIFIYLFTLIQLLYKSFGQYLILRIIFLILYLFLLIIPTSSNVPSDQWMPIVIIRFICFVFHWIYCCKVYNISNDSKNIGHPNKIH